MNELATMIYKELDGAVPKTVQKAFEEILQTSKGLSNAQTALQLCEIFTNKITIFIKKKQFGGEPIETASKRRHRNVTEEEEKDLMVFATQVLYTLRKFFTDEEITFHIAITDDKHKFVREAYVPQREVVRHLGATGGNKTKDRYVGLLGEMEAYLTSLSTQHETEEFISHWKLVEFLSSMEVEDIDWSSKLETSKGETAFGKRTEDISVYATVKWVNQKNVIKAKYYNLQGSQLFYFNQGWLWEWYDTLINSQDKSVVQAVHWDLRQGSIRSIFRAYDNIPGIRQGDYTNFQKLQIQNKYNNQKIMSYKNMLLIIGNLKIYLQEYIIATNPHQSSQALTEYLTQTFFPEVLQKDSQLMAKTVQTLINKLK